MMKTNFLFILFFLFSINSISQNNLCNYSYLQYKLNYNNDSIITKANFKFCEECCQELNADSILVNLYLADSLNISCDTCVRHSLQILIDNKKNASSLALAESFRNCGVSLYDKAPLSTIILLKKSSNYFLKEQKIKEAATCLQNIAFTYEEKLNKYHEAIQYAQNSIYYWELLKDTIGAANMYKYIGYLFGKIGNDSLGKTYIIKAINGFKAKSFDKGIAVSNFDLARIHLEKGIIDSSIILIQDSKKIWKFYNDNRRIFGMNNFLIRCYFIKNDLKNINETLAESKMILEADKNIYWKDKLDFYQHSINYYSLKKNNNLKKNYTNLYEALVIELKQKNIK